MANCTNCGNTSYKCTCSDGTIEYKSFGSTSSDCGCDETQDCCVETSTSCIEYNEESLECIGIEDATETPVALKVVFDAINDRLCSLTEELEACCNQEDSYDLSNLTWDCLTDPETNILEDVLQHIIENVEDNIITFNEEQFVIEETSCGRIVSINEDQVAQDVTEIINNTYITEIINNLTYRMFPDQNCDKNFIADALLVDPASGLEFEKTCLFKYSYTFQFDSTNINLDTIDGYIAPNGITYLLDTPIPLSATTSIEDFFSDTLGLDAVVIPYSYPTYRIRIEDFGNETTLVPQLIVSTGTYDPNLIAVVDTGETCCKLLLKYTDPNECCTDCPDTRIQFMEGICVTPTLVNKTLLEVTSILAPCASTFESITINGITYTPTAPITATDFTAIQAFLDTIVDYDVQVVEPVSPDIFTSFTIEGYFDIADLNTVIDGESRYYVTINIDDCLSSFTLTNYTFDLVSEDEEQTCLIYKSSACYRTLDTLSLTYEAGWEGDLTLHLMGNILYIGGGIVVHGTIGGATTDTPLDSVSLFTLPAGMESGSASNWTVFADDIAGTLDKAGLLTAAIGSGVFITSQFGGSSGDTIYIPNMTILLNP